MNVESVTDAAVLSAAADVLREYRMFELSGDVERAARMAAAAYLEGQNDE